MDKDMDCPISALFFLVSRSVSTSPSLKNQTALHIRNSDIDSFRPSPNPSRVSKTIPVLS